jgi:hypothetical protein
MNPRIRYALETDVPGLCKVNVISFQMRRFPYAMFPEADVHTIQEFMAFGSLKHLADPQMHVLTADDLTTNEIIAYARWRIPDVLGFYQSLCKLSKNGSERAAIAVSDPFLHAPRPCNEAIFNALKKMMDEARKKHTTGRDISKSQNPAAVPRAEECVLTNHLGSSRISSYLALAPRAWVWV